MKANRHFFAMALAVVCLLLTSCIDSKNPLCTPEEAQKAPGLMGVWRSESKEGNVTYYHVGPAGGKLPDSVMRIVTIEHGKDGTLLPPGQMLAFSSGVGAKRYLNIAFIDDKDLEQFEQAGWKPDLVKGYLLIQYDVTGDALTIREMDSHAKRRVIETKRLQGTIDKNAIFFTDAPQKIADLLAQPEGQELFTQKPTRYDRVK